MINDAIPSAEVLRDRAFERSRQILEQHARPRSDQRPSDVLEDIAETYDYQPWDIALISALTVLLHPRTQVSQALRSETARITRERRQLLQALRTFQQKYMHGNHPTVSCFQVVLAPRPGVGLIYNTGRPSEWVLNEFAGCIQVVLGQARIGGMSTPPLEPIGNAFDIGRDLLRSVGIMVARGSLYDRARALPDLPPEPMDDDPLGWAETIAGRLSRVPKGNAILRRILIPQDDLPLETFRYRMTALSQDVIVRRFTRKALPAGKLR